MRTRSVPELVAAVAGVGGVAVYLVTSTTGYLAGRSLDPLVIVLTVAGLAAVVLDLTAGHRFTAVVRDLLLVGSVAALSAGMALFLLARVPLAADVYFIPVNYPAAEATTLHLSFVGLGLYLVAVLALVVESFAAKRVRPAAGRTPVVATA
ncbi:hypothetical protein [Cellulomonas endometrii]|uniref:hypothetical protein n=1 Tax=Cellulomonas endometrii TaxID=3036301 RepID=UPI0024ADD1E8|nr:hypothetical protein [Cellulomonas endometrii]